MEHRLGHFFGGVFYNSKLYSRVNLKKKKSYANFFLSFPKGS